MGVYAQSDVITSVQIFEKFILFVFESPNTSQTFRLCTVHKLYIKLSTLTEPASFSNAAAFLLFEDTHYLYNSFIRHVQQRTNWALSKNNGSYKLPHTSHFWWINFRSQQQRHLPNVVSIHISLKFIVWVRFKVAGRRLYANWSFVKIPGDERKIQELLPPSWLAAINTNYAGITNICSGALINDRYVITAQRCVLP